jgi:hypothetical protein
MATLPPDQATVAIKEYLPRGGGAPVALCAASRPEAAHSLTNEAGAGTTAGEGGRRDHARGIGTTTCPDARGIAEGLSGQQVHACR